MKRQGPAFSLPFSTCGATMMWRDDDDDDDKVGFIEKNAERAKGGDEAEVAKRPHLRTR